MTDSNRLSYRRFVMQCDYLCNLIIPGAAKSGTSSLHEYLGAHPAISMSSSKEPHHFCRDERYSQGPEAHNILFQQRQGVRYFGESSTGYLPWASAAERVARDLENPKVILLLRHPVDRCFSHYRWRYRLGLEKRTFFEAIKVDGYGYRPESPDKFGYMAYLEFSHYSRHCSTWIDAVGAANCLLIASSELLRDRSRVLNRCFSFLDIPPLSVDVTDERVNETVNLARRSPEAATKAMRFLPKELKSLKTYKEIRSFILKATAPNPPKVMTQDERAFVEKVLAEDIRWFDETFGQSPSATLA